MRYDLTTPCSDCPFRKDRKFPLTSKRVHQIVLGLYRDAAFSCHKTTTGKGRSSDHPKAQHCAGALIFLEQKRRPHQMMRIAERLGMYDHTKLSKKVPIFRTLKGMAKACSEASGEGKFIRKEAKT